MLGFWTLFRSWRNFTLYHLHIRFAFSNVLSVVWPEKRNAEGDTLRVLIMPRDYLSLV
jgi:hypothetical protein